MEQAQEFLCIHGHFYQPPREDPFSGAIAEERAASPYHDFNERITHECYEPNALEGNFQAISFDLGPTLASWLEKTHPDIHQRIVSSEQHYFKQSGVGNALAQAYNHTILPLATKLDKETQIIWGLMDYKHRYGQDAHGLWLPETAVDMESLEIMAKHGIQYTILAPWQAEGEIDTTQPYKVLLPSGRSIAVFFYNSPLSAAVSFNDSVTVNADTFCSEYVPLQYSAYKSAQKIPQMIIIATDGEAYGHHKMWRDKFLARVIHNSDTEQGIRLCTLEEYLQNNPPEKEIVIRDNSSWSCHHGVSRWSTGCTCTMGNSSWKSALREALTSLAESNNAIFEEELSSSFYKPWNARNDYLAVHMGWETMEEFLRKHLQDNSMNTTKYKQIQRLLEAQFFGQCMFTSCGFFFQDLDMDIDSSGNLVEHRVESAFLIGFARKVISLIWQATGKDLQQQFLDQLMLARSGTTYRTGVDLYHDLPKVDQSLLP